MKDKTKISQPQLWRILQLWKQVCADRGWKDSDRVLRLEHFSRLAGRPIETTSDIGRIDECTKVMKGLQAMMGVDLQAGREADDTGINRARVLRNQILTELIPCLELYIQDVAAYLTSIMEDKNRWWKIDRPVRDITIMDLNADPVVRMKEGKPAEFPSQLEQLQYTLARCLNQKRNAAHHTIHDMKIAAHLPCACARCQRSGVSEERRHIENPNGVLSLSPGLTESTQGKTTIAPAVDHEAAQSAHQNMPPSIH